MNSHTGQRARIAIAGAVAVGALASAGPVSANPGQASCRGFGLEHAFFARELGGLGQFFREAAPVNDEVAAEHAIFCETR